MSASYVITLKSNDKHGEPEFINVDASKAKEVMARWDAHQNILIGDAYISWQRIIEVTAPPANIRLEGPKWCGKCEEGWTTHPQGEGFIPCTCNPTGIEICRNYKSYLENQSWYKEAQYYENRRRDTESMLTFADSQAVFDLSN